MVNYYVLDAYTASSLGLAPGDSYSSDGETYSVRIIPEDGYGNRYPVNLSEGDNVLVSKDLCGTVTFGGCSGEGTQANITLEPTEGGSPSYTVGFVDPSGDGSLTPTISVPEGEDFSCVRIDGTHTDGMTVLVGDNAQIGDIWGGPNGTQNGVGDGSDDDLVVLGDGATVSGSITLGDGDDTVIGGNDVTITGTIDTGDVCGDNDEDEITFGSGLTAGTILTGAGADTITLGDQAHILHNMDTGTGHDSITLGNDVRIDCELTLGTGSDTLTAGSGFTAYSVIGDQANGTTEYDGNDSLWFGDGATITHNLDTGGGNDTLSLGIDNSIACATMGVSYSGDKAIFRIPPNDGNALYTALTEQYWQDPEQDGLWTYGTQNDFSFEGVNIANVEKICGPICFTPGTLITTINGAQPIETLRPGDRIATRDHGFQAIRWMGRRVMTQEELTALPRMRPIRISAGALGQNMPQRDLTVSPQHRILVSSKIAQRMFGCSEVLVAAKQLLPLPGVERLDDVESVEYIHVLCSDHEVIIANGAWTESLYPGPEALKSVPPASRNEILTLFPELDQAIPGGAGPIPARPLVPGRQAQRMAERHAKNGRSLFA